MLAVLASPVAGLEVVEARWGYARNEVVRGEFNQLELLLRNDLEDPFDGVIRVERTGGLQGVQGAPHAERVYVSPGSSRRVIFFLRLSDVPIGIRAVWGPGLAERAELPRPTEVPFSSVALGPASDPYWTPPRGLAGFPAAELPPTCAGLGSLGKLVVDRDLELTPEQWTALADWVHGGGELLLLAKPDGTRPVVGAPLGDTLFDQGWAAGEPVLVEMPVSVGLGWVVSSPVPAAAVDRGWLRAHGLEPPTTDKEAGFIYTDSFDQQLTRGLGGYLRPRYPWGLITLAGVLYVLCVIPGHFILSRVWPGPWRSVISLVVCAALFSLLFFQLGRHGHGSSKVLAVSHARPVTGRGWVVTQWGVVFLTRSDRVAIRHDADHQLYDSVEMEEEIPGVITTGAEASYAVEIPLFSSRGYVHRGRLPGPPVLEGEPCVRIAGDLLKGVEARLRQEFRRRATGGTYWLLWRERLYALWRDGDGTFKLGGAVGNDLLDWLQERDEEMQRFGDYHLHEPRTDEIRTLVMHDVLSRERRAIEAGAVAPAGVARLFLAFRDAAPFEPAILPQACDGVVVYELTLPVVELKKR